MKKTGLVLLMMSVMLMGKDVQAAELKIGVLRITEVVNGYVRTRDIQTRVSAMGEEMRREQESRKQELSRLSAKLQQNTPGSEAYAQTRKEIQQRQAEFKIWAEVLSQTLVDEEADLIRSVYREVEQAVTEYARANGFTLIIKEESLDLNSPRSREDLQLKIALRTVMYVDPSLDVTEGVLRVLNQNYAAGKK